jgi:hypothetical protein
MCEAQLTNVVPHNLFPLCNFTVDSPIKLFSLHILAKATCAQKWALFLLIFQNDNTTLEGALHFVHQLLVLTSTQKYNF